MAERNNTLSSGGSDEIPDDVLLPAIRRIYRLAKQIKRRAAGGEEFARAYLAREAAHASSPAGIKMAALAHESVKRLIADGTWDRIVNEGRAASEAKRLAKTKQKG